MRLWGARGPQRPRFRRWSHGAHAEEEGVLLRKAGHEQALPSAHLHLSRRPSEQAGCCGAKGEISVLFLGARARARSDENVLLLTLAFPFAETPRFRAGSFRSGPSPVHNRIQVSCTLDARKRGLRAAESIAGREAERTIPVTERRLLFDLTVVFCAPTLTQTEASFRTEILS